MQEANHATKTVNGKGAGVSLVVDGLGRMVGLLHAGMELFVRDDDTDVARPTVRSVVLSSLRAMRQGRSGLAESSFETVPLTRTKLATLGIT